MSRVWILPERSDPESEAIQKILSSIGEMAVENWDAPEVVRTHQIYAIERGDWPEWAKGVAQNIDHHRPGDPGYGGEPDEFFESSSIGQVIRELGKLGLVPEWERSGVPKEYLLVAAADHCLGAAYRGECPGVDPSELLEWRIQSRAAYQGRPAEDIRADIERARVVLRAAPRITLGICECGCDQNEHGCGCQSCSAIAELADMRGQEVPELPDAAGLEKTGIIADGRPDKDGRVKVVCWGSYTEVDTFMRAMNFRDMYGDPCRGFAGGYVV